MSKLPDNPTGSEFRAARLAAGVGVRELARAHGTISPSSVARWEAGERALAPATRSQLVHTLARLVTGQTT